LSGPFVDGYLDLDGAADLKGDKQTEN